MESDAAQRLAQAARDAEAAAREDAREARNEADLIRLQREEELNRMQAALESIVETRRTAIGMVLNLGSDRVEFEFPRRLICQRTVAAVRGGSGEVVGHLVLYRDVTREAEAAAAKSEFVSLVSHELRTPLTSVKTSLNLLARGAAGDVWQKLQELATPKSQSADQAPPGSGLWQKTLEQAFPAWV